VHTVRFITRIKEEFSLQPALTTQILATEKGQDRVDWYGGTLTIGTVPTEVE
jgi:hypothetical protein